MIDVVHEINAVERHVGRRELEVGQAHTVTLTRMYAAPLEDVWDACTSADRIPRWFLPISGELHVGGRYQLEGNAGGTIEQCDPPRQFTATWEYGGAISWIELRLTPEANGHTRFELEHIAEADTEHWRQFGPGAVGVGWELGLLGLSIHLMASPSRDPREVAAWTASAEGKQFMVMSSVRWSDAHIAAGSDPEAARAAANRTAAAYTATDSQEAAVAS